MLLGVGGAAAAAGVAAGAASHVGLARPTPPLSRSGIAHWQEIGTYTEPTVYAGEGLATVELPGGGSEIVYRGLLSVPPSLAAEGWTHIGDPDSADGDIIDAYQGPASGSSKLFVVTTPGGTMIPYVHHLIPGELYNNSFDAISPDEQWMVAGTWGTIHHLQVYRDAAPQQADARGGRQSASGRVHRARPSRQRHPGLRLHHGDDADLRLGRRQPSPLCQREAAARGPPGPSVGRRPVPGHVIDLGPIPQVSTCTGTFEAEGVDYDVMTGTLRVEIIQPGSCILSTTVIEYQRRH